MESPYQDMSAWERRRSEPHPKTSLLASEELPRPESSASAHGLPLPPPLPLHRAESVDDRRHRLYRQQQQLLQQLVRRPATTTRSSPLQRPPHSEVRAPGAVEEAQECATHPPQPPPAGVMAALTSGAATAASRPPLPRQGKGAAPSPAPPLPPPTRKLDPHRSLSAAAAASSAVAVAANKSSRKRRRGASVVLPLPSLTAASSSSSGAAMMVQKFAGKRDFSSSSGAAGVWRSGGAGGGSVSSPAHAHLLQWLGGLLLASGLALLAAWDAKDQCTRYETAYALDQLVDDYPERDTQQQQQQTTEEGGTDEDGTSGGGGLLPLACLRLFDQVVVPSTAATISLATAAILWIRGCGCGRVVALRTSSLVRAAVLGALGLGLAAAQTFEVVNLLLRPQSFVVRTATSASSESSTSSSSSSSYNPYQSLAAVDRYGRVGDNANLFFLCWISEALALAFLYQTGTALLRQCWKRANPTSAGTATSFNGAYQHYELEHEEYGGDVDDDEDGDSTHHLYNAPPLPGRVGKLIPSGLGTEPHHREESQRRKLLLPATSWMDTERSQFRRWYKNATLYRLRFRAGIWVATFVACLVIVASSHRLWALVVVPNSGDQRLLHVCAAQTRRSGRSSSGAVVSAHALCHRTAGSMASGAVGALLCATAVGMHLASRRGTTVRGTRSPAISPSPAQGPDPNFNDPFPFAAFSHDPHHVHRIPLTTELILSILLSLLLGSNAIFSTGVQGPAAAVGNLYFATWLAFFLCVRICLGCVEESQNLDHDDHPTQPPPPQRHPTQPDVAVDPVEKQRGHRLRMYFFLSIFSAVCGASAYDAAANQRQKLSQFQRYMVLAPCAVAAISGVLFSLCLSKQCYAFVSRFVVGGILAVLCFGLWLTELVLTMHSDESWAVNGVGEIEVANLYFYSWAGILSAGFVMMSYVKALFQVEHTDYMSMVWIAVCKVCFVILGAALHIWHTIADNCEFDEITSGAVTFCSRTVLAIVVSLAGMLVGGLVVLGRLLVAVGWCSCVGPRTQAHVEMVVAIFLVLLFSATVALITGIGGPGQSVGDLYFSTWLSFAVAVGIFVHCEAQVRNDKSFPTAPAVATSPVSAAPSDKVVLHPPVNGSVLV